MWKAVFEGKHKSCIIAPLCKKYNVTDYVYLLNAWIDNHRFYYAEMHTLQGTEKNKAIFIRMMKKQKSIRKIETRGNIIITLEERPEWMAAYMPAWDKRIIQVKPVIQKTNGMEHWEIACWSKGPLINMLNRLPKEFKIKLKSIKQTKIDDIFLPHIMPKLSKKQKEAIELAVKNEYYNFPRKINLDGLAGIAGVSKQTFQQNLRNAEKKIIPFLTENIK